MSERAYIEKLLYLTIRELAYAREVEHISLVSTSSGKYLIEKGMVLLGVKDLAAEQLPGERE